MYIPPLVLFNRVRKCPEFEDGLSPGSAVEMSDSGYVNEVLSSYGFDTSRNTQHRVQFYSFWVNMEACKLCKLQGKCNRSLGHTSPLYACATTVGQNILQVPKGSISQESNRLGSTTYRST